MHIQGRGEIKVGGGTNVTLRTSLFTNVFCPLTLRQLLKCWQTAPLPELVFWDSGGWAEWLSQLLHPSWGGGSYILVGLRSQRPGSVSSIQPCLEGNSFCLHGFRQCLRRPRVPQRMEESYFSLLSPWIQSFSPDQQGLVILKAPHLLPGLLLLPKFLPQTGTARALLKNLMNKHHCPSLYSGLSPINFSCFFSNVNWSLIFFFFLLCCNSLLRNPFLKCSVLSHLAAAGHTGESGAALRRVFCGFWKLLP